MQLLSNFAGTLSSPLPHSSAGSEVLSSGEMPLERDLSAGNSPRGATEIGGEPSAGPGRKEEEEAAVWREPEREEEAVGQSTPSLAQPKVHLFSQHLGNLCTVTPCSASYDSVLFRT